MCQSYNVIYDSNNSGGNWWLNDKDWEKLEKDGWYIEWGGLAFCGESHSFQRHEAPNTCFPMETCKGHRQFDSYTATVAAGEDARWLGGLATKARLEVNKYTGDENGCDCCGRPHYFYARNIE